jgi:hypothetical protein
MHAGIVSGNEQSEVSFGKLTYTPSIISDSKNNLSIEVTSVPLCESLEAIELEYRFDGVLR